MQRIHHCRGPEILLSHDTGNGRYRAIHSKLEGYRGFFLSSEGAIWSRIVCLGQGFGPIHEQTTAQIIFLGMAGMEEAQLKSGNGLVDRSQPEEEMRGMSVAEYAKMRQANQPGNEVYGARKALKERQKPLGALLEGRIKKLALDDMRLQ